MTDITRRGFLELSLPVLASVGGLSTACGASVPTHAVAAGPLAALPPGPQRMDGYDVFLIRTDEGVAAISGQCTHAGCGVQVAGDSFHCGCHGSDFAADGTVTNGPAERDLAWYAVRIEDGEVVVDPTEIVPKGTFTPY